MGMMKTLECFQTEWYKMMQKGVFATRSCWICFQMLTQNQTLDTEIKSLRTSGNLQTGQGSKAKEAMVKLHKERDFHRMHHKRVAQEKNKLINDIKKLKEHYTSYEPLLRQLHEKYETVLRQKMLISLERDRAVGEATGLQATLRNLESGGKVDCTVKIGESKNKKEMGPTQKAIQEIREKELQERVTIYYPEKDSNKHAEKRHPRDSDFPPDTKVNPRLTQLKGKSSHLKKDGYHLSNTLKAHELAVSW
ncbi:hypothetical protein GDO86_017017 [Hymenochirus boettgeri]|uniref:Uncharacterized protein n=1 Tax=Hymenochirus boettgeri TaxID=247094 RepID=A0A8T2IP04_9PIPI|nr:hypothetical protein GDO86_017017 [Hymenochirus boettgeri]